MKNKPRVIIVDRLERSKILWEQTIGRNIKEDRHKAHRIATSKCKQCFYNHGVAMQAMTWSECEMCGEEFINPSTDVNRFCKQCAIDAECCVRCGVDMFPRITSGPIEPFEWTRETEGELRLALERVKELNKDVDK